MDDDVYAPRGVTASPSGLAGLAGPGTVAWKINSEVVVLLGWSPAILAQFAHPLVAAGVADHSLFITRKAGRLKRLHSTLSAMLALTFGSAEQAGRAARGINAIHDRVQGHLKDETAAFPRGTPYSAHDPALLRWVHATLLDTFPRAYELYVGPLTSEEKDRYCQEASWIAPLLGIPDGYLPTNMAELRLYLDSMLASGQIEVTPTARTLAQALIAPPLPRPARPLLRLMQIPTIGLLPDSIRARYGFPWDARRQTMLERSAPLVRHVLPLLPSVLRHWPAARAAFRRPGVLRGGGPSRARSAVVVS